LIHKCSVTTLVQHSIIKSRNNTRNVSNSFCGLKLSTLSDDLKLSGI